MRTTALFGAKYYGFFEIYGVSARTRGLSQCGHFRTSRGKFSVILCRRLLWTAPNDNFFNVNVILLLFYNVRKKQRRQLRRSWFWGHRVLRVQMKTLRKSK